MIRNRKQKTTVFLVVLMFAMMAMAGSAAALHFELGDDTTLDMDTSLTYAAGWRVKDQDNDKLTPAMANADDGNRNFDQWDMINNKVSAVMDIDLRHKNFGVFLRPKTFYDQAYMSDNANDSPFTNNNSVIFGGPLALTETDEFTEDTEDAHGHDVQLLDAFAYANLDMGGHLVSLRVGRQVVNWGESLFLQGGISSAQGHLDVTASNTPGTELKELFLPSEAAYVQADITDSVALSAYYQWKWEKHVLNESGSFFATADMLDENDAAILHPLVPTGIQRAKDDTPSDSGQFGVSLIYVAPPSLLETEFGLYYINYHEKAPIVVMAIPNYFLTYAEDVKLSGFSVSSMVGAANVAGEISYRQDFPVALNVGTEKANVVQAQVSVIYILGNAPLCDSVNIMGEVGYNEIMGLDNDELAKDKFAWGFSLTVTPNWIQILPKLDMSLPMVYGSNPNGNSSYASFTEGADKASIGLKLTYNNAYILDLKYSEYFNDKRNAISDRDNLTATLKYTF